MNDLIVLRNIRKSYIGVKALRGVNLTIGKGEVHCLLGENGCGKSTMIKVISGVVKPDDGEIFFEGKAEARHTRSPRQHHGIAVIYQDLSLFPNLTVAENIAYCQVLSEGGVLVNHNSMRQIAQASMDRVKIDLDLDELVGNLPIGKQQMVAICRAMVSDLKLLILDEPTASLAKTEVDNLLEVVRDLQSKGISILFVSHKLNEILAVAQTVTVMRDGETVGTLPVTDLDDDKLVYMMTGRRLGQAPFTFDATGRPTVLEVRHLSKKNNFDDVSFQLRAGEILGITGLIGSGRTELALALYGVSPAESGVIRVRDREVSIRTVAEAVDLGIAYVPENRLAEGLVMRRSVGDNVVIASIQRLRDRLGFLDHKKRRATVSRWIDVLGVKTSGPDMIVGTLSGGNQQKVVLAKCLALEPSILILDGPTVGIDVGAKSAIHDTIRSLAGQGMAVILISDEIPEVLGNCSRVLLMRSGRVIEEVSTSETNPEDIQRRIEAGA